MSDAETAVRASVAGYAEAWRDCLRTQPDCDPGLFAATTKGAMLDLLTSIADRSNADGRATRNVEDFVVTVEGVELIGDDGALVRVCSVDGTVAVLPSATGDEVINDNFASAKVLLVLQLDPDGVFRISQSEIVEKLTGRENDLCAH
jgi:hypothetical protein